MVRSTDFTPPRSEPKRHEMLMPTCRCEPSHVWVPRKSPLDGVGGIGAQVWAKEVACRQAYRQTVFLEEGTAERGIPVVGRLGVGIDALHLVADIEASVESEGEFRGSFWVKLMVFQLLHLLCSSPVWLSFLVR